jgi:hypothetical protein
LPTLPETAEEFLASYRALQQAFDPTTSNPGGFELTACVACSQCVYCSGCERCHNCRYAVDCVDSYQLTHCAGCRRCYSVGFCYRSEDCSNSNFLLFCSACSSCDYCIGCIGLQKKDFHILNHKVTRAEYFRFVAALKEMMNIPTL